LVQAAAKLDLSENEVSPILAFLVFVGLAVITIVWSQQWRAFPSGLDRNSWPELPNQAA
jgi:hypothetical protein